MPLLDLTSDLGEIFGQLGYLAPFTLLLLCGLGFPLPEEAALIGAGILLHRGQVEFGRVTLVCSAAILLGDSLPYWIGHRYGMRALEIPWVGRVLHPERFQRLQRRFDEHGNWATFVCRFLPMFRIPGYFIAGTMGMRYLRFLALDAVGVVLTVPVSIYLGKFFGGQVERLKDTVHDLHLILAFMVLSLFLVLLVRARRSRSVAVDANPSRPAVLPKRESEPPGMAS